jgi:hypothetical protein
VDGLHALERAGKLVNRIDWTSWTNALDGLNGLDGFDGLEIGWI